MRKAQCSQGSIQKLGVIGTSMWCSEKKYASDAIRQTMSGLVSLSENICLLKRQLYIHKNENRENTYFLDNKPAHRMANENYRPVLC